MRKKSASREINKISEIVLTLAESNYLRSIAEMTVLKDKKRVGLKELSVYLSVQPASVNDMFKRLGEKGFIFYKPYRKVALTNIGMEKALYLVRCHRLWETFLTEKLGFAWEEIHEIAAQLYHVRSFELFDRLDGLLGNPEFNPHGEPIPRSDGSIPEQRRMNLLESAVGQKVYFAGVMDDSPIFLKYVQKIGFAIGDELIVEGVESYDNSIYLLFRGNIVTVSEKFARQINVVEE